MTAASETRVGWCPGALRPMPSGDGLIVRVKPRGATLSPAQAIGIAAAASSLGNGALDLTRHANLQIRGASDASLPGLTEALDRLGLLDPDIGAETRRNVMMSPLAGFDPEALFDIRPVVAALEDRLVADAGLAAMPAKFGFSVSDGGRLPLGDVGADVTFDAGWRSLPETGRVARSAGWGARELHVQAKRPATPPDALRVPPSPSRGGIIQPCYGFTVRLAGDVATVAFCPTQSVPDVAALLAGWFVAARAADPDLRRMRQAVARFGAPAIVNAVGLRAEGWLHHLQPSWPGLSRPPMPGGASQGREEGRSFGVGHFSLRAGVGGRDEPGHDDEGEVKSRHGLGVVVSFERVAWPGLPPHPQSSSPGLSRPPTPTGCHVLGVAAPFGRLDSTQLDTLARGAFQAGASELRLTPWRSIPHPGADAVRGRPARRRLRTPRALSPIRVIRSLRIAACPGAPGCHRGTTPVLDHAARWATLLGPGHVDDGIVLHVSGCAKGCAPFRQRAPDNRGRGRAIQRRDPRHAWPRRASIRTRFIPFSKPRARVARRDLRLHPRRRRHLCQELRDDPGRSRPREPSTQPKKPVAVRIIHACGMVEAAADIRFTEGAVLAARAALRAGAPVLCDARMVADGVTRRRLPAGNDVICTLNDAAVPELAGRLGTTRTAAAVELWGSRLGGAVVAIGNAPTALFHLLELLGRGRPPCRPAIVGMPVGFVGWPRNRRRRCSNSAASRPWWSGGRKGGSAMTAATVNAWPATRNDGRDAGPALWDRARAGRSGPSHRESGPNAGSAPVVSYFAKKGHCGVARTIADRWIPSGCEELPLHYPLTTEIPFDDPRYGPSSPRFTPMRRKPSAGDWRRAATWRCSAKEDPLLLRLLHAHLHSLAGPLRLHGRAGRHGHVGLLDGRPANP